MTHDSHLVWALAEVAACALVLRHYCRQGHPDVACLYLLHLLRHTLELLETVLR